MTHSSKQSGFTLIELIIVIVILGILAITALPRFVDMSDDAHASVAKAVAGAYKESVNAVRARYVLNDHSGKVRNMIGYADDTFDVNEFGYPVGVTLTENQLNTDGIGPGSTGCLELWSALLTDPPSVSIDNDGSDYESNRFSASVGTDGCVYILRVLGDTGNRNNADIVIEYDSTNGTVTFIDRRS